MDASKAVTEPNRVSKRDVESVLGIGARRRSAAARVLRPLLLLVGMATILGGGAYWLLGSAQPAVRYVSEPAALGSLTVIVTATGSVQPTNKVEISSELSGRVSRVLVDYNSPVEPGQLLAELDAERLQAAIASARARLVAARARVAEAVATVEEQRGIYQRRRALAERQVVSAEDLAGARAAFDRSVASHAYALAEVEVAEAELAQQETDLSKARITSPIRGIVLERSVDPGQTVAASLQAPVLFTIAEDLREMELQVDVDEADIGAVRIGQAATFGVDAYPARRFPAEIRDLRFAPEVVQRVVTYKAVLAIDNAELLLRPGMTATADIVVERLEDAMLVPNAALRFSPPAEVPAAPSVGLLDRIVPRMPQFRPASRPETEGPDRVLWVLRDSVAQAVPVVVGASDGRRTALVEGAIEAGDAVIVDAVTGSR